MPSLLEFLSEFLYWFTTNEYFRSGFVSGIALCIAIAIIWQVFFVINYHWKKIRQFFEPTKKPGKMPTEVGPSPASMSLGCVGRVLLALFVITVMILLVWVGFPES